MDKKEIMTIVGIFIILIILVVIINNLFSNDITRFSITILVAIIIGLILRKTINKSNK
ncbi:MAG: hypothetical protein ISP01_00030 [Methanobrevibacter arboriphilus]|jgi:carbon starvation protein CstA|uniref:Uncharacterized protein n=2 Tax=Methanobrevibacter arboriphilus TaxID=39441 RepID=A0A843AA84_METAZ|nr:hypothetical protein [Methanobrevibacter arboriphilus]MBF4467772.1 hypothetical protein [Methanobrevibacter arboriphilus]MCC7562485.1 hypothetical protein [Methanobrevibacter arboriphilus]BBL61097.1 hypothetical protein MarbSA_01370 [Methanobrevibacter arboriphilus]GLI12308.1 hypothetical protein MARBORIA2_13980 [Methanobrevibacter arboriphilus]